VSAGERIMLQPEVCARRAVCPNARGMKIEGISHRSLWLAEDGRSVHVFDQTRLPWKLETLRLAGAEQVAHAIRTAQIRGAALVGVAAAYGIALALRDDATDPALDAAAALLLDARPGLACLHRSIRRMSAALRDLPIATRVAAAYAEAAAMAEEDVAANAAIGRHGRALLDTIAARHGAVNVLTHGHAGWTASVDWGTALAPVYMAHDAGLDVHVWVSETRPRGLGAALTAWELGQHGVPHTVIADGASGQVIQRGAVDIVLVGAERISRLGDLTNTIGTYPVALAARDNGVPFWAAVATAAVDGTAEAPACPVEERPSTEVTTMTGRALDGSVATVRVVASGSRAANPAHDVTPSRLITGLITDRGVCPASEAAIARLFPGQHAA